MDTDTLPDEKARLVRNIKGNVIAACLCMAVTVLSACFGASSFDQNLIAEENNNKSNWIPFIALCLVATSTIISSAAAWYLADRNRKLLVQLQTIAVAGVQQPGVWPPPPNGLKR